MSASWREALRNAATEEGLGSSRNVLRAYQFVMERLSRIDLSKLLQLEKSRRGAEGRLVFIGMADVASSRWCAAKSLLASLEGELAYFGAYLFDRLAYSLVLGYVRELPVRDEELLHVGDEITFADIERLLKEKRRQESTGGIGIIFTAITFPEEGVAALNPRLAPEKKAVEKKRLEKEGFRVLDLKDLSPIARGQAYHLFFAEKYASIRWNFSWEDYVVVGVPDGITDEFVYEFKTTRDRFLLNYVKWPALTQGDLYGYFFRRGKKRVQIYVVDEDEILTWHGEVDRANAEDTLKAFKDVDENREFPLPKKWKCKSCEYRGQCQALKPRSS
ncbi:hypothetical protein [Thermofilum sp.]|uniref:hypothetical protein n=1 Tax=Thermofilum sp. TaxID=1961369 RepID=UPI0031608978